MATPTPSTNTPQKHLPTFSSPAPRSVPGMVNFDSPAALGLLAEGGIGMGISMSGMSGMGIGMGMGMSGLGLSASAMGRADEDERRRRLMSIIDTLKTKPGRISQEGILALCKKEGLEVIEEPQRNAVVELLLMIGSEAMCVIPVRNGEILTDGVKLELTRDGHNYAATGSRILANSLRPLPGMTKINLTLERFSHNLDKLLRMDKLSAPENGGVSCYQAIFGVYTSLRKLFEHEKKMALAVMEANTPYASHRAEREVLCKKSGRPRINGGSCLGLSLEYWMDRRHIIKKGSQQPMSAKGKDKMDVDSLEDEYPEDGDSETNAIYSLSIECESSPSSMYSPIRISDAWISDAVEKTPDTTNTTDINNILLNRPTIDWLEPPPTYLPSAAPEGDHDAMNLDNTPGRLPNIRFVAKFDPPLVLPLSVFVTIQQSLGLELPNDIRTTTFVGLSLRPGETDPGLTGVSNDSIQELRAEKSVLVINKDGKEEQKVHSNSLYVPRTEYSRMIESLPFSHPRQLVEILPILRQYAFTTSLLQRTFGITSQTPENRRSHSDPLSPPLTPDQSLLKTNALQLDISLSYAPPAPRLRFDIPHPASTSSALSVSSPSDLLSSLLSLDASKPSIRVTLDIQQNADLVITEQNVVSIAETKNKDGDVEMPSAEQGLGLDDRVKRLAKALEVSGDVGFWSEWVRREVERRTDELRSLI